MCFLIGAGGEVLWSDASESPVALPDTTPPPSRQEWLEVVLRHVAESTTLAGSPDVSQAPDKAATEAEKEALSRFRTVLQPFVRDKPELQLAAVYALQVSSVDSQVL